MSRLPFELFLALRYLRPRSEFVSVITLLSVVGVAIGVMVLTVVIAVMSGFDREWRERILSFNSHLKIARPGANLYDFPVTMALVRSNAFVKGAAPYVLGQVLIKVTRGDSEPVIRGPVLRGADPSLEPQVSGVHTSLVTGTFDLDGRGLIVGSAFARDLGLHVGDRVSIYSPRSLERMEKARSKGDEETVLPDDYTVRGVFDVGFNEFNQMMMLTSLENAQDLYKLDDAVHGLFVMIHDPMQAQAAKRSLQSMLGPDFRIVTWVEENATLFGALVMEKNMMYYLLFFILIVAAFAITNSQITFVMNKSREIGALKALGASRGQVISIFLSQSVLVGLLGVVSGLLLGLVLVAVRNEFLQLMNRVTGRELLPVGIYQIGGLPAEILPGDLLIICGGSFLICLAAGVIPAWKAGRLQPVEALRND